MESTNLILSTDAAKRRLAAWRVTGDRVVFTNGCFDLLHPGHVAYLEDARSLGERLVVGVNDDDSVRRLKGSQRPILPWLDRARILAGLKAVDMVVAFAEDTPRELILQLRPDLLVKGGDYVIDDIIGVEEVRSWGGAVQVIPFREGYSTSDIIGRIRQAGN